MTEAMSRRNEMFNILSQNSSITDVELYNAVYGAKSVHLDQLGDIFAMIHVYMDISKKIRQKRG